MKYSGTIYMCSVLTDLIMKRKKSEQKLENITLLNYFILEFIAYKQFGYLCVAHFFHVSIVFHIKT